MLEYKIKEIIERAFPFKPSLHIFKSYIPQTHFTDQGEKKTAIFLKPLFFKYYENKFGVGFLLYFLGYATVAICENFLEFTFPNLIKSTWSTQRFITSLPSVRSLILLWILTEIATKESPHSVRNVSMNKNYMIQMSAIV